MGTVVNVYSSVSNIIEEAPEFFTQSLYSSIFNETDIARDLNNNIAVSYKYNFASVYRYSTDTCPELKPVSSRQINSLKINEINRIIAAEVGEPVQIIGVNIETSGRSKEQLPSLSGWDEEALGRSVVTQEGMGFYVGLINPPADIIEDAQHVVFEGAQLIADDHIRVRYGHRIALSMPSYKYITVDYTGYDLKPLTAYYHATYRFLDKNKSYAYYYWSYRIGSGVYPELDKGEVIDTGDSPYFPIVPIRQNNEDMTGVDKEATDLYKHSDKILSTLGIDIKEVGTAVHGDPNMEPPDEQLSGFAVEGHPDGGSTYGLYYWAYVKDEDTSIYELIEKPANHYNELPLNTSVYNYADENWEKEFKSWKSAEGKLAEEWTQYDGNQDALSNVKDIDHSFVVFGAELYDDEQSTLDYLFRYFDTLKSSDYLTKEDFIAWYNNQPKHEAGNNKVDLRTENNLYRTSLEYHYIDTSTHTGVIGKRGFVKREVIIEEEKYGSSMSYVLLTKQLTDTTYKIVKIHGLRHVSFIAQSEHSWPEEYVTTLENAEEDEAVAANILIPLHYAVAKSMPVQDEINMYYHTCKLIISSYERIKLKWYQSSAFFKLLKIVGFVITVISLGSAYLATESIKAFLYEVAKRTLIAALTSVVAVVIIDLVGLDAAIVLAILGVAVSMYNYFNPNFVKSLADLPFAEELLLVVSSVPPSSVSKHINKQIQELASNHKELLAEYEEKYDELEKLYEELELTLDTDVIVRNVLNQPFNSTPDNFYYRTIHAGNIGVRSLDAIQNYVDNKLTLPTITDTITI